MTPNFDIGPYFVQQIAFLHQLLQENNEDIWFGCSHRPGCVTLDTEREKKEGAGYIKLLEKNTA